MGNENGNWGATWIAVLTSAVTLGCGAVEATTDAGIFDASNGADSETASCTPDTSECADGQTTICGSDGTVADVLDCPLGCHTNLTRCNDVAPSNGLGAQLDLSSTGPDLVLDDGSVINTDTGLVLNGAGTPVTVPIEMLAAPTDGVAQLVLIVRSAVVHDVDVVGSAALVIVSNGDIEVRGELDLAGAGNVNGPGVGPAGDCAGKPGVGVGTNGITGGGGGGYGTAGAAGGDATMGSQSGVGGVGGSTTGNQTLTPLRGGCRGGGAGDQAEGRAGGATQIVSRTRIVFVQGGYVNANGGGGYRDLSIGGGGAGGGSGGGVLLEAPTIEVAALSGVAANGGGGGSFVSEGEPGALGTAAALGGNAGAGTAKGNGGNGGARDTPGPTAGETVTDNSAPGAGGGGGGSGRVRLNTHNAAFAPAIGAVVSPEPSLGRIATR